jgi:hypothetical protein
LFQALAQFEETERSPATMSFFAARWMDRKQIVGWKFQHGCSTGQYALTPSF